MDQQGLRHIILFSSLQKSHHRINRCVLVMMAAVTGIGLFVDTAGRERGLGKHEPEGVAVGVCYGVMTLVGSAPGLVVWANGRR